MNMFTHDAHDLSPLPFPVRQIGTLNFSIASFPSAVASVIGAVTESQFPGIAVHFANAYNIALAQRDLTYREMMLDGDLVFMDGQPVVWAGAWLHREPTLPWERVYGPDVMEAVLESDSTGRHYFLGGEPKTLSRLVSVVAERFPQAHIAGSFSPPFRRLTEHEVREQDARIAESGATCVWVGLGTPRQDYEVQRLARALPVTALAVGAAFDFIAGTVRQAPDTVQRMGLEWAFRFAQEPRRLARRYLVGNPLFVTAVLRQKLSMRRR
jgi:N-acetylglucosaminyldiphosphoundecaprenol N-acetyl-beta-D-mannosaminyltransferase